MELWESGISTDKFSVLRSASMGKRKHRKRVPCVDTLPNPETKQEATRTEPTVSEVLRPNRGWFFAPCGVLAGYIIGELHAPLWLAISTALVLFLAGMFWPWIEKERQHKFYRRWLDFSVAPICGC
jgi:hypothetical protein